MPLVKLLILLAICAAHKQPICSAMRVRKKRRVKVATPTVVIPQKTNSSLGLEFRQFLTVVKDAHSDLQYEGALQRVFSSMSVKDPADKYYRKVPKSKFFEALAVGPYREFVLRLWEPLYGLISCPRMCALLDRKWPAEMEMSDWLAVLDSIGPCWPNCFKIDVDFDYDKSTKENYMVSKDDRDSHIIVGYYEKIRALRDSSYHGHYVVQRQHWQDAWIRRVVERAPAGHERPWLIYTAGGMGVGKGFVMKWLTDSGYLGMENVVYVNPDYFKSVMPEYREYQNLSKEEGTSCHDESSYMQEIALWSALERQSHVMEDGSLRDTNWYAGGASSLGVIPFIKERFPAYRVAIIHIDLYFDKAADKEAEILGRLKKRENSGERATPPKKALDSYAGSAKTVNALVEDGRADFVVQIDNTNKIPRLVRIGGSSGWQEPLTLPQEINAQWNLVADHLGPNALLGERRRYSEEEARREIKSYQRMFEQSWDMLVPTIKPMED